MVVAKFGKDAFDKFLTDAFSEAVKNSNDKEWLLGWIRTKSLREALKKNHFFVTNVKCQLLASQKVFLDEKCLWGRVLGQT